jgi:hypothetical protein
MQKRTKGCLWIALGVACFLIMVGVAVVGGLGYVIYQTFNVNTRVVKQADAAHDLDSIRAQFAGQTPKLTITETPDGKPDVKLARPTPSPVPLTWLHVAAYDPSKGKLVQVTIPFWLLRMAPAGKMKVNGDEILNHLETPSGKLTAKDIEALGPGLLVDHTRPDGTRVIMWTEGGGGS